MALSVSHLLTEHVTDTDGTINHTTASITPASGAMLLVVAQFQHEQYNSDTSVVSASGGGLSWSQELATSLNNDTYHETVAWIAEGATGASMTVTVNLTHVFTGVASTVIHVYEITGYNSTIPTDLTGTYLGGARSGAYNLSLGGTTDSDSITVAWGVGDEGTATLGGTWTSDANGSHGYSNYRIGHKTGAISVVDFTALDSLYFVCAGAIEIQAASVAGPPLDFPASPSHNEIFKSNGVFYIFNSTTGAWENYNIIVGQNTSIEFGIDGNGSAITVGTKGTIEIPFDLTLSGWTMLADQSGSANVDLWSREYSTTLPTQGNTMTGNIGMTISTATANQSTEISNWVMNKINAGNVVTYNVQSCSTITRLTVNLFGIKE